MTYDNLAACTVLRATQPSPNFPAPPPALLEPFDFLHVEADR